MGRSLLDGANLSSLRRIATGGPAAALAACLVDSGLLQFDPHDAAWADRDRVTVCGDDIRAALAARLAVAGADAGAVATPTALGGDAMALAFGAAMASRMDGGIWRSWCVLGGHACDDGRVWEVARAAAAAGTETLAVLVVGSRDAPLWRACGWRVHTAPAADPAWLLGAIDHAVAAAPGVALARVDD